MERGHYVAFINVGASLKAWLGECNSMRTTYNMYLYTDIKNTRIDQSNTHIYNINNISIMINKSTN